MLYFFSRHFCPDNTIHIYDIYLFGNGYQCQLSAQVRFYWSMRRANSRCRYVCWISEEEGRPRFHVRVQDDAPHEASAPTPRAAWAAVSLHYAHSFHLYAWNLRLMPHNIFFPNFNKIYKCETFKCLFYARKINCIMFANYSNVNVIL